MLAGEFVRWLRLRRRARVLAAALLAASLLAASLLAAPGQVRAAADPLAPSGLTVALRKGRVTLNWRAPAADAELVTGYQVLRRRPYRGERELAVYVADTGSAETVFVDLEAVEPGERYVYRVKALRGYGRSGRSNFARIDLPDDYTPPESEPEPDSESEPEPDSEPDSESEPEPDSESEPEADSEPDSESEPEADPDSEARPGSRGEPVNGLARAQSEDSPGISEVVAGDGALTVVWDAPSGIAGGDVVAYDLRHIASDAADKADGNWTVAESVWESGPRHHVLDGLANGTGYDVQVRAVTATAGPWSATAAGTPSDHGDSWQSATALDLGVPAGGLIGSGTDTDYFTVTLTETLGMLIYTTGGVDLKGSLQDRFQPLDDGVVAEFLTGANNFLIWGIWPAGTYHIAVEGDGGATGSYVLHTEAIVDNFTHDRAIPVEVDSITHAILEITDDCGNNYCSNWFELELSERTDLMIRTTGLVKDTLGAVSDDQRTRIAENGDGYLVNPKDFMIRARLDAGVYHIEVQNYVLGYTGPYSLHVEQVAEPGSTLSDAAPLAVGGAAAGRIEPSSDVDYFRLEIEDHSVVGFRAVGASAGLSGTLLDGIGNPLASAREETFGRLSGFEVYRTLAAGTYYLQVAGEAGTGGYAVATFEDPDYRELLASCGPSDAAVSDPLYGCQWNLDNRGQFGGTAGEDINIGDAWQTTMGQGVGVAVVDTGVDYSHEDLTDNFDLDKSHDYTGFGIFEPYDGHGTAVAGTAAARDNAAGIRGVAPRATVYSFNMLLDNTIANEADAMARQAQSTAVSNNSWGPPESPRADRASRLWELAVESGLREGHDGRGTFYAWSAGNGHWRGDDSNLDEYANFHGVTAVCAVNHRGTRSWYSEMGANLWLCAPSSDDESDPGIATTGTRGQYSSDFGGTSAAAPQVSGAAALVRSVNTALSWRDVKLILAGSARKNDSGAAGWETGAAQYGSAGDNYEFNHSYGFGVLDAGAAVELARNWTSLPALATQTRTSTAPAVGGPRARHRGVEHHQHGIGGAVRRVRAGGCGPRHRRPQGTGARAGVALGGGLQTAGAIHLDM